MAKKQSRSYGDQKKTTNKWTQRERDQFFFKACLANVLRDEHLADDWREIIKKRLSSK